MLYLILQLGDERFALDTRHVVEIIPYVNLKTLPATPPFVSGIFNYRGTPVPVIDLSQLTTGETSHAWMTTRIVLTEYPDNTGEPHILGLLVEQVNDTLKLQDQDFSTTGISNPETPYLGPVTKLRDGLVQRIELEDILPDNVRALLFTDCA